MDVAQRVLPFKSAHYEAVLIVDAKPWRTILSSMNRPVRSRAPRPFFLLAALLTLSACVGDAAAAGAPASKISFAIPMRAEPFPLENVRLLGGPFRDAMQRDEVYLLSLDPDGLLHNFRVTAGLPSSAEPLGGWEKPDCELRGHSVGHYLSACALMYASTGNEALKSRADAIVTELAKCQEALPSQGYSRGFLSAYPESLFDRVDRAEPVWAPYYTLHKIMAGLLDVYEHCGNPQALAVLTRMADWLKVRVDRLSVEQMQRALGNEHGGMNEVLANLYAVTGNPDHLKLAQAFNHEAVFVPLAAGEDKLDGLHANTQIPKITGAARQYELTGDARMRRIAEFFWDRVALNRSYVIGGHSDKEHFFPVTEFDRHLSPETAETCNTYNLLKLTRHLFEWEPSAPRMDFYERGLYNQILASQDPDSGMVTYFMPLQAGRFKTYSTPLQSFWCCLGTGMENHAKYGDTIYFHGPDSLYVNLFIPSELDWRQKGVTLRQETKFPEQNTSTLTLRCSSPVQFALKLRYPSWAEGMIVRVNGRKQKISDPPGSYLNLDRTWRSGDRIQVNLPMRLHWEPLPGTSNVVAFLYGPLVLAGELGTNGLPAQGQQARDQLDFAKMPVPVVPVLSGTAARQLARIQPVKGQPLAFRIPAAKGAPEILLDCFYRLHHQRYAVYWQIGDTALSVEQRNFMKWRFGMFLHFNLGTFADLDWAGGYEDPALFRPTKLDCGQWADVARDTGMTYLVLTVKHTEGIALYDSAVTAHDITLFKNFKGGKGDIVREFVNACRSRGLKVGLYYCFPGDYSDAEHHNAPPPGKPNLHGLPPEAAGNFAGFMKKQLAELLTQYGPIDLLWIDQYANKYTGPQWQEIRAFLKSLQPHCLVLANNAHTLQDSEVLSYEFPWQHLLPPADNTLPAEVCDTIQTGQRWFWREVKQPSDLESAQVLVERLKTCNSRNANYLLDVPPDRDGLISGAQLQRLREIGALLKSAR